MALTNPTNFEFVGYGNVKLTFNELVGKITSMTFLTSKGNGDGPTGTRRTLKGKTTSVPFTTTEKVEHWRAATG